MNIGKDDVAIFGFIATILYNVFGLGRKVQKSEDATKNNTEEIAKVKKLFTDENGDPRIITVTVCGAKQEACREREEERHKAIVEAQIRTEAKVDKVLDHLMKIAK